MRDWGTDDHYTIPIWAHLITVVLVIGCALTVEGQSYGWAVLLGLGAILWEIGLIVEQAALGLWIRVKHLLLDLHGDQRG